METLVASRAKRLDAQGGYGASRASMIATAALLCLVAAALPAHAVVYLTQEQALALAFADPASAQRRTAYLTEEQAGRIKETAGTDPSSRAVVWWEGAGPGGGSVTAWFDTHLVRTLPETVMVVVAGDGTVVRVDILSFDEPDDYLPSRRWLDQFNGKPLSDDLSTRRSIRAVTGATMSSAAVTATVRRVLALHAMLHAPAHSEPQPAPPRVDEP